MNKKLWIGLAALILIALLLWWMSTPIIPPSQQAAIPPLPSTNATVNNLPNSTSLPASNAPPVSPHAVPYDHQAEMEREKKVWNLWLATPITFYGKVVDTDGNPVADATASISMVDTAGPGEGHTKLIKKSNVQGLFSASGHGLGLTVQVSKDGYYSIDQSVGDFAYVKGAGQLAVYNDPKAPAVFMLRKMGETEPLIMIHRDIIVPKDGTPTQMDLTTGHTYNVTHGDIMVQAWTHNEGIPPNGNHPYDWKCKITVLRGGLQPRTGGEFDFIAPESGYQPSDEINMPASMASWSSSVSRSYFLQLGNGDYTRIDFQMIAGGDHFFAITSYLNPVPGHRNLEFDPAKQINKK